MSAQHLDQQDPAATQPRDIAPDARHRRVEADTLTAREVADRFGWATPRTPCRLAQRGQFPAPLVIGGRPKWTRRVIDQVLAGHWQPKTVTYFRRSGLRRPA